MHSGGLQWILYMVSYMACLLISCSCSSALFGTSFTIAPDLIFGFTLVIGFTIFSFETDSLSLGVQRSLLTTGPLCMTFGYAIFLFPILLLLGSFPP
jgi:hypothetical protein